MRPKSTSMSGKASAKRALQGMDTLDDRIIETPEGPMTWAEWKKKNRLQVPSRRTKGKDLPVKVKLFTDKS